MAKTQKLTKNSSFSLVETLISHQVSSTANNQSKETNCHVLLRARCLNTCLRHQILRRILNQGKGGSFQLGGLSTDALYQSFPLYRVDLFFSPQLRIVEQNYTTTPSFGLYWLCDTNCQLVQPIQPLLIGQCSPQLIVLVHLIVLILLQNQLGLTQI